ncbi:MAG: SH3-like domain-containing protein [Usitatibacter sp.]
MAPADPAVFAVGHRVRVRSATGAGHVRTPRYILGKRGVIERLCGPFRNPEQLALAAPGLPRMPLYRVRFLQREVWHDYAGAPHDTLDIELFQHWLEPDEV